MNKLQTKIFDMENNNNYIIVPTQQQKMGRKSKSISDLLTNQPHSNEREVVSRE